MKYFFEIKMDPFHYRVGKDHKHLLRDIRNYIDLLTEANFGPSEFFVEDCYKDATGKLPKIRLFYMCVHKNISLLGQK